MKDFLVNLYDKLHTTLLGPVVIGVLVFGVFFDFSIIEPSNTAWILRNGGDVVQHYLGSLAFRSDSWHFPVTKTVLINHPEGVSIIFTDSNPLLSILAKCIKFIFPPYYQFFGFWFLLCWILQSVFGYLLIKKLTGNKHYALLSSVLFCLLPTQLFRLAHANLVAFWVILWALYVFINDDYSWGKKQRMFFLIFILSSLIHPYLLFMVSSIGGTWYIVQIISLLKISDYRTLFRFLGINALYGLALVANFYIAGYFYNTGSIEGLNGFGSYSMNLNAPFNVMTSKLSNFMNPLPYDINQYEGYQYLGIGILALFISVTWYTLRRDKPYTLPLGLFYGTVCILFLLIKQDSSSFYEKAQVSLFFVFYGSLGYALVKENQKALLFLYIPATLCFLYSLSNKIMLGKNVLYEYIPDYDSFYIFFLQSARSSGRFFWVTLLFLLISGLFLLYRYFEKDKQSMLLLSLVIFLQYIDIPHQGFIIASNDRSYESALDPNSRAQIMASREVHFLSPFDMNIAAFALSNNKLVNTFYTARVPDTVTVNRLEKEYEDFINKKNDPRDLYLIDSPSDLPLDIPFKLHSFYGVNLSLPPSFYSSDKDIPVWLKHRQSDSLSTLIHQIKTNALVLIAVKDDASYSLPLFFKSQLDSFYTKRMNQLGHRNSYVAVFKNGKLVNEFLEKDKPVEYEGYLVNHHIFLKSSGYDCGNEALMQVDGANLSINKTGLNVLVLENEKDKIWQVYNYNTFGHVYTY